MRIGTREVGPTAPVFVIAECGSNHGGSLDAALALIDAAADAGADAAKFQRFRVDSFIVPRPNPEALRRYELPDEWLPLLRARCAERGIEFLCTAFDFASLDVVDPFVNAHKVGSWEAVDFDFCRAVTRKNKPVIASLGRVGNKGSLYGVPEGPFVPLVCRSEYPAPIAGYLDEVGLLFTWGVSDHTLDPTIVPAAATALGACVVEKHMRLGNQIPFRPNARRRHPLDVDTPDTAVSIGALDFAAMVRAIRATQSAVRG